LFDHRPTSDVVGDEGEDGGDEGERDGDAGEDGVDDADSSVTLLRKGGHPWTRVKGNVGWVKGEKDGMGVWKPEVGQESSRKGEKRARTNTYL
jgi:hypothetical protein